jgi:hypothetical protein
MEIPILAGIAGRTPAPKDFQFLECSERKLARQIAGRCKLVEIDLAAGQNRIEPGACAEFHFRRTRELYRALVRPILKIDLLEQRRTGSRAYSRRDADRFVLHSVTARKHDTGGAVHRHRTIEARLALVE